MQRIKSGMLVAVLFLASTVSLSGQQGHPLVGSWHGTRGTTESTDGLDLTVIVDWDGSEITGMINPVTDRAPLLNAQLDSSNWTVRFEADLRGEAGNRVRCIADGRLDKLGSDRRTLNGTLICGEMRAGFELTRDRDY